jgi:hypothetical protein
MSSTAECHILRLPVEILQDIAAASPDPAYQYSTLRLVCKDFEAAFFDQWAEYWIGRLRCFLLDPARVQRIKNITSRKHLARKIKSVCLCLDPWEHSGKPDIYVVPNHAAATGIARDWSTIILEEQDDVFREHHVEEYKKHQEPPDQDHLASMLRDLDPSCSLEVELSFQSIEFWENGMSDVVQTIIVHSILNGIRLFNVRYLRLYDFICDSELLLQALRSLAPTLEGIHFMRIDLYEDATDGWPVVMQTLEDCPRLNHLCFMDVWDVCASPVDGLLTSRGDIQRFGDIEVRGHEKILDFLRLNIEEPFDA